PAPVHVKQLIGKLADLTQEAEHKEKTEADLKRDNASLRGQLLALENQVRKLQERPTAERIVERPVPVFPKEVLAEIGTISAACDRLNKLAPGPPKPGVICDAAPQPSASPVQHTAAPMQAPAGPPRTGAMRMLAAVASFHPKPVTKQQIGALVGMAV